MRKSIGDIQIAGSLTTAHWKSFRGSLTAGHDPALWERAFQDYFHTRLTLRYLDPIKVLQENGTFLGEGFSITAIQCSIVEFLESTVQGKSYRYVRKGDAPLGPYEYSNSREIFTSFLTSRHPFQPTFTGPTALDFYEGVRCGLLHEARTKNGWTILAKSASNLILDAQQKIVYRDDFQTALLAFVDWYRLSLPVEPAIQEAFLRKFDSLCV
jgi:hypothetical protein